MAALIWAMVGMDRFRLLPFPSNVWRISLYICAGQMSLRGFFFEGLSQQEHAAYALLAVLLLLLICCFVAGHHIALAFPLIMTVVPLSLLIFVSTATTLGAKGKVLVYRVLALAFGPLCLLQSFDHDLNLWIQKWRMLGAENLPLLLVLSTVFSSGCLRYVTSEIKKQKID